MECARVLVFYHFVLFLCAIWTLGSGAELVLERPLGATEQGEVVVEAGEDFSLTCRGDGPLSWGYDDYEPNSEEQRSEMTVQERQEHGQFVSTLTVHHAYFLDTGYFRCYPRGGSPHHHPAQRIYVYVKDPENLLAVNDTMQIITGYQWDDVVIPCRPTDPGLEVVLLKEGEEVEASFDPHVGFRFEVTTVHQSGEYECQVPSENYGVWISLHVSIRSVKADIEKPHVDVTPMPVVEGMNVTLECSVHYDIGIAVFLNWTLPDPKLLESGRVTQHNSTLVDMKEGDRVKSHKGVLRLTLYDVRQSDNGPYTCHVHDSSRNHNNNTYHLAVLRSSLLNLTLRGQKDSSWIKVNPGENNVQLLVDINAHPPPKSFQWYDNHMRPILVDQNPHSPYSVKVTQTESKLTIKEPDVRSSGTYTLVVNNDAYNKSINVTLQVMGEPELRVNGGQSEDWYLLGQEHVIDCEVFGFPSPNISWFINPCADYPSCDPTSSPIPRSEYSELEVKGVGMPLKSSVRLRAEHTAELRCEACNTFGCKSETTTFLVSDVPGGFSAEGPKLVVVTDNITLTCGASKHNFTKNLKWFYSKTNGAAPISVENEMKTWSEETKYSYLLKLNIPHVNMNHTGNYHCSGSHRYGRNSTDRRTYFMRVKRLEKPIIHKKNISTKLAVRTGSQVIWHCRVHGTPPPTIIWYRDNMELVNKPNLELRDNNQTLIVQVGLEDDAVYTCEASNKAGKDALIFQIELTDKPSKLLFLALIVGLPVVVLVGLVVIAIYARREVRLRKEIRELTKAGLLHFEEGNVECLNPDMDVIDQADLLPYDRKKWEFPRDKLKLGKPLGFGAFGMVLKAEAYELMEEGVATTVAVKMVKRNSDVATIKALASELKIMTHLGKHLNVVNVLGACTEELNKRELLVLVEYCPYGNLQNYLLKHRGAFINQVNPRTRTFDPTIIQPTSPTSRYSDLPSEMWSNGRASMRTSAAFSHATDTTLLSDMSQQTGANMSVEATPVGSDGYLVSRDHEWRASDRGDYRDTSGLKSVCTQDLICWAFQIARGMEYLASRKVLHGDLATRNVLLAEENIVKICDFGFSKSIYRDNTYQKKGDGPLPVKWMALESIRDRVFSTQSDVWAYGITLWEMFSLSQTPYPGLVVDEKLFNRLEEGWRMPPPKYATDQVYKVMQDCWMLNPHSRPSFTELAERMGGMLEDTVRTHYVDLNDPHVQENSQFLAQQDYLSMLRSPSYANWSPADYSVMRPQDKPKNIEEALELMPMLDKTASSVSPPDSPDGSPPITKPIGNNYVNVAQVMGFSNPSYHNLGRPKQSPYVNMPDSADES